MAHKALIGGAAYEISGGKTLVNGTAYSIDKGKTLVGGTAYEVGFAPATAIVTISATGDATAWIRIDGVDYAHDTSTVEIPVGTVIVCMLYSGGKERAILTVNGSTVYEDGRSYDYEYTVNGNVSIEIYSDYDYSEIHITEE